MPIPAPPVRSPPRIRCSFYILTRSPHRPSPPIGTAKARQDGQAVSRRRHGHDTPGTGWTARRPRRCSHPVSTGSGMGFAKPRTCRESTAGAPAINHNGRSKDPGGHGPAGFCRENLRSSAEKEDGPSRWTDVGTPERLVNWLDSRRSPSWSTETRPTAPHPSATCAR